MEPPSKTCTKCGRTLPATVEFFYRQSVSKDGLQHWCRECAREYARKRNLRRYPGSQRAAAKEERESLAREGLRRCFSCGKIKTLSEFYRSAGFGDGLDNRCRPCRRLQMRERRSSLVPVPAPPGAMRRCSKCKADLPADLEHFGSKKTGKWGLDSACKPCRAAQGWEYGQRRGIEWRSEKASKSRAKRQGAPGSHTHRETWEQFDRQRGTCFYCGVKLRRVWKDGWVEEHVVPVARGGSNGIENIVIACCSCNLKKSVKDPQDFAGIMF